MDLRGNELLLGWRVQARAIRALFVRDIMMRYGRDNIGFVWVVLEPMILTSGVMVIWYLTIGATKHDVKLVEFVMTGYMPLTLWRHLTNSSVHLFRRSVPLLYHRSVSLFDIVFARHGLELVATSAAFMAVWGPLTIAGVVADVAHWDLLLLGWFMMAWLGFGFGMILAAVTEYAETAERFVQPVQYLMIPVSGAFMLTDWVPQWAQAILLMNPMVHCYEVFRGGYFGSSVTVHYSVPYFSVWAFILTFVGMLSIPWIRPRLQLS